MKLTTLRVVQGKPSGFRQKPAAGASHYESPLARPVDSGHPNKVVNEDRRRSQRVLLRIRAQIHVALQGRSESFEVTTLSVNHRGALVVMDRSLPPDTRFVLENANTKERVACKVVHSCRETADGFQVPVEFDAPAPDFWRIAFPPSDWRPDES